MKKLMLILIMGVLLLGANAFATGDLEVNGKIGIGKTPVQASLDILATGGRGLLVELSTDDGASASYGIDFSLGRTGSNNLTNDVVAFTSVVTLGDTGNRTISGYVRALANTIQFRSLTAGASTVTSPIFANAGYGFVKHADNLRTYTVNAIASNITTTGHTDAALGGAVNYSDLRSIWIQDSSFTGSSATNLTGIWVDAITVGSNNYGIVLDGNGAGSDIVFGSNQEARIYSSGGRLYADDSAGNQTIISPHDPETGEWIFYSKNVKTGKVVRVDMARLVKAVEKLTGETFMVETLYRR